MSVVGCEEHQATARALREASVCICSGENIPELGDKPFFAGCAPFQATLVGNPDEQFSGFAPWMQKHLGGKAFTTSVDPDTEEIARAVMEAVDATSIVLCTYNGHVKAGQLRLVREMAELGKPVVCCALRDPYDLAEVPENVCGLCFFEYTREIMPVVRDVLTGKLIPGGKLSVKL